MDDFSTESFSIIADKIAAGDHFSKEAIRNGAKDFYNLDLAVERYDNVYTKIMGE